MKIMVIDDSVSMRKIITSFLSSENCEIIEAESGLDALGKVKQNQVDCFIVDINMPDINGIEFGKSLRMIESFKTTPLIFVTTEISDLFQKEIEKIGVSRWLNKPFGKSELLSCLT